MQDYVKWRGPLFHRFLLALVDDSPSVRALAEYLLTDTLASKASRCTLITSFSPYPCRQLDDAACCATAAVCLTCACKSYKNQMCSQVQDATLQFLLAPALKMHRCI